MTDDLDEVAGGGTSSSSHQSPATSNYQDDEISLLDLLYVLAKHKRLVFGVPFAAAILTAGITLLMPDIYTGRVVLMPPQQQQSTAAMMLGQLGALAGVAGSGLGIKNPNDLYIGMLKSRTVADALIEQYKLKDVYDETAMVDVREQLADNSSLISGRDGLIVIEVEDSDPKRAADLAGAYAHELINVTQLLAITEASQRRLFFENQLSKTKEDLASAEVELRKTQERTGMIALDEQGRVTIEAAAMLRAQVTAKEVEMTAMRTFATDANPNFRRTQEELVGLRAQLAKMERNSERDAGDILISTGKIPAAGLEYARKLREVKYYEAIFELMAKQYEIAKIDEAKDASIIQILDRPVVPEKPSGPKRLLLAFAMTVITFGLVVMIILGREMVNRKAVTSRHI